jgi:two-component system NtrC family sensor kinase
MASSLLLHSQSKYGLTKKEQGGIVEELINRKKMGKMIFARVVMLPVSLLLLVCAVIVFYFVSYSGKEVENKLIRIAGDHRDMIDSFLNEKSGILKLIAENHTYENLSRKDHLLKVFNNLQSQSRAFVDIGVFDSEGNHVAYAGPFNLEGKNYVNENWFQMVRQNNLFISDEFLGFRQIPHFVIAVKKQDASHEWYLRATIDTHFFNALVDSIRIGRTGHAYIINRDGVLKTMVGKDSNTGIIDYFNYIEKNNDNTPSSFFGGGLFDMKFIYCAVPLTKTNWALIVRQETLDAYFPLFMAAAVSVLIIFSGGTIVVVTGFIMASNMANRLRIANAEKKEMKTQLIIAGKLAEVGEMSTGIAHEINNPLQIIKSETAMMDECIKDIEKTDTTKINEELFTLKDCLDQIKLQVTRCGKITRGLLTFARKKETSLEEFSLEQIIPSIVHMVDEKARVENVKIIQEIEKDLPLMKSDSGQIQQVVLNLLNNSIYALKGRSDAQIRISIKRENKDAVIVFQDNGCGFKKEELEKAFVPFFTTKPVGEGTGLGLSTVYGIVKGLGGDMTLTSEYGQGAQFVIRLPFDSENIKNEKKI